MMAKRSVDRRANRNREESGKREGEREVGEQGEANGRQGGATSALRIQSSPPTVVRKKYRAIVTEHATTAAKQAA